MSVFITIIIILIICQSTSTFTVSTIPSINPSINPPITTQPKPDITTIPHNTKKTFLQLQTQRLTTPTTTRHTTVLLSTPNHPSSPILIDLQTLLKLTQITPSGGAAKTIIQSGNVKLNGNTEIRRSKKLYEGDVVTVDGIDVDVQKEVEQRGYVYKSKSTTTSPSSSSPPRTKTSLKADSNDSNRYKGDYRSEEWRLERKRRKYERKLNNHKEGKRVGKKGVMRFNERLSSRVPGDEEMEAIKEELFRREGLKELRDYDSADDVRVHMKIDWGVEVNDE
eukprot:CAMPEP_0118641640 /NCGR_PEP_ID=MMETSP0785-20121206/5406_1 /TAXON_ID=91992 /ORGANISM="Bolidomonas pacifica, Strain CCMP 1866" /LENGTH=279 /DNA_ID=CAMNT_0006533131 /DNA_START=117 /DNA_END=953 /DNA_ORIENTATION=+